MPKKEKKVKLVAYLPKEVHDRIIDEVLKRVHTEKRFRGVISEVTEDFIRDHFGMPERR